MDSKNYHIQRNFLIGPAFSAYKKEGGPSKNYLETVIRLYLLK